MFFCCLKIFKEWHMSVSSLAKSVARFHYDNLQNGPLLTQFRQTRSASLYAVSQLLESELSMLARPSII